MTELNIFESAPQIKGEFKKFEKVGDSVQGTYIDSFESIDGYNNEQIVVVLKENDKIWNVGIRKTSTVLIERMAPIKFGQIIGFRFEEERESKKMPGKMAKIINVYHDPRIVDQEWLDQKEEEAKRFGTMNKPKEPVHQVVADESATPVVPAVPVVETKAPITDDPVWSAIRTLALTKGLTSQEMPLNDQDSLIEAFSGLTYDGKNSTQIISKLSTYTK